MTTTISIAYEVSAAALARVETLLAETAAYDCNWNGADFRITRDDFTCIEESPADEYTAAALLRSIYAAIDGQA